MKIRGKIFLFVLTTATIIYAVVVGYLGYNFRKSELLNAKKIAKSHAEKTASHIKTSLEKELAVVKSLANTFSDYYKIPENIRTGIYNDIMMSTLKTNPKLLSVWISWDLSAINSTWTKSYGRQRVLFLKTPEGTENIIDTVDLQGDNMSSLYYKVKISKQHEFLSDPYFYTYKTGSIKDSILETSVSAHILTQNQFCGIAGFDVELSEFQSAIITEMPFENANQCLISNNGKIVAHTNVSLVGKKINEIYKNDDKNIDFLSKIANGKSFEINNIDDNGDIIAYTAITPIIVGETGEPWAVAVYVPVDILSKNAELSMKTTIVVGLIGFVFLILVLYFISARITKPMNKAIDVLRQLDKGDISLENKIPESGNDELSIMAKSLNHFIDTLNKTANFALNVGKGNYVDELKISGEYDILGLSLNEMRKNLQDAEIERQKVFSETQKRSLIQEGITEITEILQLNYQNVEELSYQVISSLVKYLNAGQGGIFFAEKNKFGNNVLILKAAYAFDKKKKLEAEIEFGESLVGRCAKEKEMIYLEHLPQGYTVITSGLGGETPSVLVLSPLLFENNVYGVLEIASFNKFEDFQIEFIKLISERVASVVSNLQINSETAALLEQSRKQSEELEAKEREMVNTISELEKVQVDILMREAENKGIMTAVNSIASVTYFDMEGRVTNINQKNLESFGMFKHDVIGKNHFQLLAEARENPEWFEQFWNDLREGKQRTKEYYIQFENKELWLYETFTPILNKDGFPEKVINIGIDITAQKLLERELEKINSTKL